jgi:thiamine biosynthesis lipoprotein ApbE
MADVKAEAKAAVQRAINYLTQAKEILVNASELEEQHASTANDLVGLSQQTQHLIGQCNQVKKAINQ